MKKKYALYIGRWQNWHKGHEWLIKQQFDKGKNIWIAIRNVEIDENNPKSAQQILKDLSKEPFIIKNADRIMVSIVPDIESINYGRGVGYAVVYHHPPDDIGMISGTKIREGKINENGTTKETYSKNN
jgi:hypothetical protein